MDIRSLVPSNWGKKQIPIRREEERSLHSLQRRINQLFDGLFEDWSNPAGFGSIDLSSWNREFYPRWDISEGDRDYEVAVELPGIEEKDIDLSLNGRVLTVRGEKKGQTEEKLKDFHRVERTYGTFNRSIPVPEDVDPEGIEASFRNGVLTITLPKSEAARKERKKIPIRAA